MTQSPATLLIVGDEAVVAADLEDRLIRNGYKVCGVAASGEEAVIMAREHRPGLALMDIRLDGPMDGIQTADLLRGEFNVPVIFLSAPFEERKLRLNIEMALHKHRGDRELAAAHQEIRRLNASLEQDVRDRTAELAAAITEIDGFVQAAAHHLRSPLRAMEGYSYLLTTEYAGSLPEEASRFPAAIGRNARQMARLVDGFLSFINLRLQPVCPTNIDIAAVAGSVLDRLIADEPDRLVEAHIEALPACHADPILLQRLLVELLSNALKFTRGRRPAAITVGGLPKPEEADRQVYFVRDNGIGFDTRYADKLFALFSQLNLPEAYEGTGSGLAVARRIVERMGGRIWAESSPGRDTTFFFTLPVAP